MEKQHRSQGWTHKKHVFAMLYHNHQYMYQSVNMTIPICHCLKAVNLHSDLLRDQLYHLNVPEECKVLWITPISTHKHLNQD